MLDYQSLGFNQFSAFSSSVAFLSHHCCRLEKIREVASLADVARSLFALLSACKIKFILETPQTLPFFCNELFFY